MDLPLGRSPDMPAPVVERQDLGPLPVSYYEENLTTLRVFPRVPRTGNVSRMGDSRMPPYTSMLCEWLVITKPIEVPQTMITFKI